MTSEPARDSFDPGNWPDVDEPRPERRPLPIGLIAFLVAVLLAVAEVVAVLLANNGQFAVAAVMGQTIVLLTGVPVIAGVVAIFMNRGRLWGIAAVVLGIITNPLVLIAILSFFSDL